MRLLLALSVLLTGCVSMVEHRTRDDADRLIASGNPRLVNDGLCIAAANGWLEQVTRALRKSADASAACSEGEPPLAYALQKGRADVVFLLFEKGPDRVALQKPSALLGGLSPAAYCEKNCAPESLSQLRALSAPAAVVAAPKPAQPAEDEEPPAGPCAVVVGIEGYQSLPRADYALSDARAVRRRLESSGFESFRVAFVAGPRATRETLTEYLERWLPQNVAKGETLFFYFAGNGAPDPKTGEAYLLPWDGDARFPVSTGYPLKKLYADLARTAAGRVVVVLDAGFSGAKGRSALATGARPLAVDVSPPGPLAERLTVLVAASGLEGAGASAAARRGLLTTRLLEALSASPKASARELHAALAPRVTADARRQGREQTPLLTGAGHAPILP